MVTADDGLGDAVVPDWIVCQASTRSVVHGLVLCPRGSFSAWAQCWGCRFLEGAEADRDVERSCSVEPTAAAAETRPEPSTMAWSELIIELL